MHAHLVPVNPAGHVHVAHVESAVPPFWHPSEQTEQAEPDHEPVHAHWPLQEVLVTTAVVKSKSPFAPQLTTLEQMAGVLH